MAGFFVNNADKVNQQYREQVAENLLSAAVFFVSQHQKRLSKPFPPASKKGQYPALRTGLLLKSTMYRPETKEEVAQHLFIRVGYDPVAEYGAVLEIQRGRLGLMRTLKDLRSQLGEIIGKPIGFEK